MTFSWDFNTGTLSVIGVQIVLLIVFLVKTNSRANAAHELAVAAHKRADEAHTGLAAVNASLSMTREQVAREHPSHTALGAMEERLTDEIHRLGSRLDQFIDGRKGGVR